MAHNQLTLVIELKPTFLTQQTENPGHGHHWLALRLRGERSNRSGVGARLTLVVATPSGTRRVHRRVGSGGSFGASSLRQEIGLGDARALEELPVCQLSWMPRRHRRLRGPHSSAPHVRRRARSLLARALARVPYATAASGCRRIPGVCRARKEPA